MVILQNQLWPQFLRSQKYSPAPKKKKNKDKAQKKMNRRDTMRNYDALRAQLKLEAATAPPTWDMIWEDRELIQSFADFLYAKQAENRLRFALYAGKIHFPPEFHFTLFFSGQKTQN